jgi:hypothetical protein
LTRSEAASILDIVGGLRHLGFVLIAGVLFASPSLAGPATHVFTTHVPSASRVEARVAYLADWDVSVTFDAETCEVYCEYRPKPNGFHLFLPPATELRIYGDGAEAPLLIVLDPAGTRTPVAANGAVSARDLFCIEGRRFVAHVPARTSRPTAAPRVSLPKPLTTPPNDGPIASVLRI